MQKSTYLKTNKIGIKIHITIISTKINLKHKLRYKNYPNMDTLKKLAK